jgi:P-type Mg2+ transporter
MIQRFMFGLGPISSVYDFLTFGVMLFVFKAGPELVRTGWFVESLATQILVVFAILVFMTAPYWASTKRWLFAANDWHAS